MNPYGKTPNVFARDPETHKLIDGEYSTDELRHLAKLPWEFTEKVDGTNIRIIYEAATLSWISIRGRTDKATVDQGLLDYLHGKELGPMFKELFPDIGDAVVCVYGEGYGAGIQKGGLYSPVKSFAGFDVKVGHIWLDRGNAYDVISKLGLKRVPLVTTGPLVAGVERVRRGLQSQYGDFYAEGLVARTPMGLLTGRAAGSCARSNTRSCLMLPLCNMVRRTDHEG